MRLLTPRRCAATALCAALTLGAAGPAVAHSDSAHAPLPKAESLMKQVKPLDDAATLLDPITILLTAVITANEGKLATADATKYSASIDAAMEAIRKSNAADTPNAPTDETTADDSQVNPAPDAMDEALANVDKAVDELVAASTKGTTANVELQVQATVKSVADMLLVTAKNAQATPATNLPAPNDMTQTPAV
ncbi:hypothetical protein [Streptomyces sp. NPDC006368]|uniref:hypothetical protein n=1 Tax=Streptomyces sp. NPDC006368 TaxID=3156760 RepID=UPI0033AF7C28